VVHDIIDRVIEIVMCGGMEMNVEKTKVIRLSWEPFTAHFMIDQKKPENVEYFSYLGSMIAADALFACEIKSRITMAKQHSTGIRLFTSIVDLNLRKKLLNCCI
jgi:hypothetical protein